MSSTKYYISFVFLLLSLAMYSQKPVFRVENEEMILRLERSWNKQTTDSILAMFDMSKLSVDSAWRFGSAGQLAFEGWLVRKAGKNQLEVYKSTHGGPKVDLIGLPLFIEPTKDSSYAAANREANGYSVREFGYNEFKNPTVYALNDSLTVFRLDGYEKAQKVLLSGSFNNWSTSGYVMKRDTKGWMLPVKLQNGKHEYKFIVDGRWMRDPMNLRKVPDNAGDYNSVYFKTNHTFSLKGFSDAKNVILAGSFNNWNERQIALQRIGDYWKLDVFLPDGTYGYKFIVNGEWIIDPQNPDVRPDQSGNLNTFISIGTPTIIELNGYTNAKAVFLTGSFNQWGQTGLAMRKSSTGWELPVVISSGLCEYQFIVDGKTCIDSTQLFRQVALGQHSINFKVLQANYLFELKGYQQAKSVSVTGSFCDWQEPGYPLKYKEGTWQLPFYLSMGKIKYKFIVDGQWILDPSNSSWEENEFGTGNSVLWIEK